MGDHKLAYDDHITFLVICNLKSALCVLGDYAIQRKSLKNLSTSTNFGPKPNNFEILVYTLDRFELSKNISRYGVRTDGSMCVKRGQQYANN
jgi:hypothetical protein